MRRVLPLAAALCLAAAGCSTSDIDPDATVRISGRALDAAGRPLADTRVLLFKQADLGEVALGTVLVIGTLSTVCLLPEAPPVCARARTATTDQDGRYDFELKGSDTQGTLGTESSLNVVFADPRTETSTTVTFTAQDSTVRLPDARAWRARVRRSAGPGPGLAWSPLPPSAGADASYSIRLFDGEAEAPSWSEPASGREGSVDPRVLEDRPGTMAVSADARLDAGAGAGEVTVSHLSARLPVGVTAGAPPSRGRPCAAVTGTRPRLADPPPTCPLTDGDAAAQARLRAGGNAVVTGAVVDLGSVRPVDLVVARGFAGTLLVEVSTDGRAWQGMGSATGVTVALELPGRPSARFVRVRSTTGIDQSLATELSVW